MSQGKLALTTATTTASAFGSWDSKRTRRGGSTASAESGLEPRDNRDGPDGERDATPSTAGKAKDINNKQRNALPPRMRKQKRKSHEFRMIRQAGASSLGCNAPSRQSPSSCAGSDKDKERGREDDDDEDTESTRKGKGKQKQKAKEKELQPIPSPPWSKAVLPPPDPLVEHEIGKAKSKKKNTIPPPPKRGLSPSYTHFYNSTDPLDLVGHRPRDDDGDEGEGEGEHQRQTHEWGTMHPSKLPTPPADSTRLRPSSVEPVPRRYQFDGGEANADDAEERCKSRKTSSTSTTTGCQYRRASGPVPALPPAHQSLGPPAHPHAHSLPPMSVHSPPRYSRSRSRSRSSSGSRGRRNFSTSPASYRRISPPPSGRHTYASHYPPHPVPAPPPPASSGPPSHSHPHSTYELRPSSRQYHHQHLPAYPHGREQGHPNQYPFHRSQSHSHDYRNYPSYPPPPEYSPPPSHSNFSYRDYPPPPGPWHGRPSSPEPSQIQRRRSYQPLSPVGVRNGSPPPRVGQKRRFSDDEYEDRERRGRRLDRETDRERRNMDVDVDMEWEREDKGSRMLPPLPSLRNADERYRLMSYSERSPGDHPHYQSSYPPSSRYSEPHPYPSSSSSTYHSGAPPPLPHESYPPHPSESRPGSYQANSPPPPPHRPASVGTQIPPYGSGQGHSHHASAYPPNGAYPAPGPSSSSYGHHPPYSRGSPPPPPLPPPAHSSYHHRSHSHGHDHSRNHPSPRSVSASGSGSNTNPNSHRYSSSGPNFRYPSTNHPEVPPPSAPAGPQGHGQAHTSNNRRIAPHPGYPPPNSQQYHPPPSSSPPHAPLRASAAHANSSSQSQHQSHQKQKHKELQIVHAQPQPQPQTHQHHQQQPHSKHHSQPQQQQQTTYHFLEQQTLYQQAQAARAASFSSTNPDNPTAGMLTTIPVPYSIGINKPKKGSSYFSPIHPDDVLHGGMNGHVGDGTGSAGSGGGGMNSEGHNNFNGLGSAGSGGSGSAGGGEGGRLVGEYEQHPLRQQTSYLPISAVGGAQFVLKPPRVPKPKVVKGSTSSSSGTAAAAAGPASSASSGQKGREKERERDRERANGRSGGGNFNENPGRGEEHTSSAALANSTMSVSAPGESNREMTVERPLDEMVLVKEEDGSDALKGMFMTMRGQLMEVDLVMDSDVGSSTHKDKVVDPPSGTSTPVHVIVEPEQDESTTPPPPPPSTDPSTTMSSSTTTTPNLLSPSKNTFAAPARPSRKVKRYACDVCGQIFTRSGDVKRHKETRHVDQEKNRVAREEGKEVNGVGVGKGRCRCPYCDRILTRQDALQRHWDKYCRKKSRKLGDHRRRGLVLNGNRSVVPMKLSFRTIRGKGKNRDVIMEDEESEVDELESEDPLDNESEKETRRALQAHSPDGSEEEEEEIDELDESGSEYHGKSEAEGLSPYAIYEEEEVDAPMDVDSPVTPAPLSPAPAPAPTPPAPSATSAPILFAPKDRSIPDPRSSSAPASIISSAFITFKPLLPRIVFKSSPSVHSLPQMPLRRPVPPVNGHSVGRPILPAPPGYELRNAVTPTVYPVRPNPTGRRKPPALLKGFTSTFPAQPAKAKKGKSSTSASSSQTSQPLVQGQGQQSPQGHGGQISQEEQPHQHHQQVVVPPPPPVTFPPIQQSSYATTSAIPTTITIPPSDPPFLPSTGTLRNSSSSSTIAYLTNNNHRRGPKPRRNDFDAVLDPSETAAQGGQIRMRVLPQATYMPPVQPALAIMHEQPHVAKRKGKRTDGLVPEYGFVPREYVYRERGAGNNNNNNGGGGGE